MLSPDKNYEIAFYDFEEPMMGMNICKFYLMDLRTGSKTAFPLYTLFCGQQTSWSRESTHFLLPISSDIDFFFIYNLITQQFAALPFKNVWILHGYIIDERVVIEFDSNEIPDRRERESYPTKKYSSPEDLEFKFSVLEWKSFNELSEVHKLVKGKSLIKFDPIDCGWREFKGLFPQTTEVLVWELNKFAEYGDKQAQAWIEQVKNTSPDFNYWVKASVYIGYKKRGND